MIERTDARHLAGHILAVITVLIALYITVYRLANGIPFTLFFAALAALHLLTGVGAVYFLRR